MPPGKATAKRAAGTWIPEPRRPGEPALFHLPSSPDCPETYTPGGRLNCGSCDARRQGRTVPPTNRYPGPCARCLERVPARAGELFRTPSGVWAVVHSGPCPEEATA